MNDPPRVAEGWGENSYARRRGQRTPCWCRDSHIKLAPERPEPPREGEPGNSRRTNGIFPAGKGGTGILDLFTVNAKRETWSSPAVWRE